MPDSPNTKPEHRRNLRQRRAALSTEQQQLAARGLIDTAVQLPSWPDAERIAVYVASDGEIDPALMAQAARRNGTKIYLPVIKGEELEFARWSEDQLLQRNRYDIPEPPPDAERCPAGELDIMFLPLVGWDVDGGRLGMGGGFYDRALAQGRPKLLVGLGHECQRMEQVPRESWDIPMDFIVTGAALYRRREEVQ